MKTALLLAAITTLSLNLSITAQAAPTHHTKQVCVLTVHQPAPAPTRHQESPNPSSIEFGYPSAYDSGLDRSLNAG